MKTLLALALAYLCVASTARAHSYLICKSGYPVTVTLTSALSQELYQVQFIHNNNVGNPKFGSCWWHDLIGGVWVDTLMSSNEPFIWTVPLAWFQPDVCWFVQTNGQGALTYTGCSGPRVPGSQNDALGTQGYFFFPPALTCGGGGDSDYGSIYDHNNNLRYYVPAPTIQGGVIRAGALPYVVWPSP